MTEDELEELVREALSRIAPEAAEAEIDPAVNFRDQMDFDSMDFLNFVIAVHERLGVDIPEADYPKLSSLKGCVSYLAARLAARAG